MSTRDLIIFALHWPLERSGKISQSLGRAAALATVLAVAERERAVTERERLIAELQETLGEVKTLKGFISICASCKKIRDDTGY